MNNYESGVRAARGDRKPCTETRCTGTMQFSREPLPASADRRASGGARGWVCSSNTGHFRAASSSAETKPTDSAARENWDDEGGAAGARR